MDQCSKRKNIFSGKKNTEPPQVEGSEDKKFNNAVISFAMPLIEFLN